MAEIYVPGPFDFVGTANALSQLQSAQQARQSNALQMQYTMEDRARADQARKAAAGNALAERAALSKALEYSVVGGAGPEQPNLGRAADTLAKQGLFGSASTISNYLEQIAKQEEQQAKATGQGLTNVKTGVETNEKRADVTKKAIEIQRQSFDYAQDLPTLKALITASYTPGHPLSEFHAINGVTLDQALKSIDDLAARGVPFETIRERMSQGATKAAENIAARGLVAAQTGSAEATTAQTVAQTAATEEKRTAPVPKEMDAGGEILVYDSNPLSKTHLQILKRVNKTLTPSEAKPAPVTPTNLAKLITERNAFPEGSADRAKFDAAIAREIAMSDVAQTDLGKAVSERAKLKPGDPLIAQYDAYIAKLVSATTAATIPAGYRLKPNGDLEFIPGGPADPKIANRSTPAPANYRYKADGSGDLEAIPGGPEAGKLTVKSEDAIVAAEDLVGKIEALLKHPGKSEAVGISFGSGMIPGTDARGFIARHNEILGSAFLDAYNSLRGTGSITEIEGVKATAAKNRMDLSTSEEEYTAAAEEYMGYIKRGVEREKARMQKLTGGANSSAAGGDVVDQSNPLLK